VGNFWNKKGPPRIDQVFDILVDHKRGALDLRRAKTGGDVKKFKFLTIRARWLAVILVVVGTGIVLGLTLTSKATTTQFFASSCLGEWHSAALAEGEPDAFSGDSIGVRNSASVRGRGKSLFCSGFAGEIPEDEEILNASVKLSIRIEEIETAEETPNTEDPAIEEGVEGEIDAQNVSEDTQAKEGEETTNTEEPENVEEPTSAKDSTEAVKPLEVATSSTLILEETVTASTSAIKTEAEEPTLENPATITEKVTQTASTTPEAETIGEVATTTDGTAEPPEVVEAEEITAEAPEVDNEAENSDNTAVLVSYTTNGTDWKNIGSIAADDIEKGVATAWIPGLFWDDVPNIQVRLISGGGLGRTISDVILDAVWLEVEHEETVTEDLLLGDGLDMEEAVRVTDESVDVLQPGKRNFGVDEDPSFEFKLPPYEQPLETSDILRQEEDVSTSTEPATLDPPVESEPEGTTTGSVTGEGSIVSAVRRALLLFPGSVFAQEEPEPRVAGFAVTDPAGKPYDIEPRLQKAGNKIRLEIPRPENRFRAGKYHVKVDILQGDRVFTSEYDFVWGVLTVNFNKSLYTTGDEAYVQIATLSDSGDTLCGEPLTAVLTQPGGKEFRYSTGSGSIVQNGSCGLNNVTDEPDYFFYKSLEEEGAYTLTLTNTRTGFSITDTFDAKDFVPYDIERIGATRINPFKGSYKMTLIAGAYEEDFNGRIVERVPEDFTIVSHNADEIINSGEGRLLVWNRAIPAGGRVQVSYVYRAPEISPMIFFLGAARMADSDGPVERLFRRTGSGLFEEGRRWQLASDAILCERPTSFTDHSGGNTTWDANGQSYDTTTCPGPDTTTQEGYSSSGVNYDDAGHWNWPTRANSYSDLAVKVQRLLSPWPTPKEQLIGNLNYATAMCRIKYWMVPGPQIPATIEGQAEYWKAHWNTHMGAGTTPKYILDYRRTMNGG